MARKTNPPRDARRNGPLDAQAWIAGGLDALSDGGVDAVRVEPLAKKLRVTKGSFYWHFADRRALVDAMLTQWKDGRVAAIREQAGRDDDPAAALRRLAELYTRRSNARGLAIELAIRALARNDEAAARAVQAVDAERLRHVGSLFGGLGWPARDASMRAVMFYSYLFGQSLLDPKSVRATDRERSIKVLIAAPI